MVGESPGSVQHVSTPKALSLVEPVFPSVWLPICHLRMERLAADLTHCLEVAMVHADHNSIMHDNIYIFRESFSDLF